MVTKSGILYFNIVMAILLILSSEFMIYLRNILQYNSWDNLIFFIGYVPLRVIGYVLMPNFPIFVFIIMISVDAYYFYKIRKEVKQSDSV
jgi:hypothetical protein